MSIGWHFGEARPDQKAREPQVEKFFGADVVSNLANALVREGIQNSLDARDDQRVAAGEPVRVRIRLGEIVEPGAIESYTAGLWQHLEAQDDEHLPERPSTALPCQFLAFEDFNTHGLCGNPEQCWPDEDPGNAFFNFFRAEGHSEKREVARGRHGLGKHVFARASRARCFFGLTRRSDDGKQFLMGAAVVRTHKMGAVRYLPDGWYGSRRDVDGFVLPVESPAAIKAFTNGFDLLRTEHPNEPGLSVIVPWLDASIGRDDVIDAVLRGYFHPVLAGQLVVTVFDGKHEPITIDAATIREAVQNRGEALKQELIPLLDLAEFSLKVTANEVLTATVPASKPEWNKGLLSDAVKAKVRDDLQAMRNIALHVPVKVKSKRAGAVEQVSHFDLYMARDPASDEGKVIFIREGLIVSDTRPRATPGVRALVIINDAPLATFLGDAENPAHTQWQKSQVDRKYTYPDERIRFVVQSVPQVLRLVSADQQTPDPSLWLDLFSIPADEPEMKVPIKKPASQQPGVEPEDKPGIPPSPRRAYRIDNTPGGFVLRPGAPGAKRPYAIFIPVAYDARGRDPFRSYTEDDFDLNLAPIRIDERKGVKVTIGPKSNQMLVRVTKDDFELAVDGFGTSRDVITDPKVIPPPDEGEDTHNGTSPTASTASEDGEVLNGNPA